VVLVDFWTYSCINCVRTLPYLKKWYDLYKDKGLVIVGVQAPEFEFEKSLANVTDAVKRFEIKYPVALDNEYGTWRNYHNNYWPAHYLIDKAGIIRDIHFGEGEYVKTENMIRSLLGLAPLMEQQEKGVISQQTPEIYLGFARAQNYTSELTLEHEKTMNYDYHGTLGADRVGLKGSWFIARQCITAKSNTSLLNLNFIAQHVYLVLSTEKPSQITVLLDGNSVPPEYYSKDMNSAGQIVVNEARMYEVLHLKNGSGRHMLTLQVSENVSLYSFTFGGQTK
jgi:thiol-disulfide isomerase/thioredoxin